VTVRKKINWCWRPDSRRVRDRTVKEPRKVKSLDGKLHSDRQFGASRKDSEGDRIWERVL